MAIFLRQTLAVVEAEVRKLRHDPTELLTRAIQPLRLRLETGAVLGVLVSIALGGRPSI